MFKKGDTLIEVALAVGIFSMIAISISAVMSSGVSNAQTALETTITREEIDTQAEALRFIHASYIADKNSNDERFKKLWLEITNNAVDLNGLGTDIANQVLQYTPSDCGSLYNLDSVIFNPAPDAKAFIINPRGLSGFTANNIEDVYIAANQKQFTQAITYPRLIYGNSDQNDDQNELVSDRFFDTLYRAEGIYIIAVRDSKTELIGETAKEKTQAFYDFYIRTCWYGSNANEPSTISTVIRLYDPDAVKIINKE